MSSPYNVSDIQVLSAPAYIRQRPGMYIGSVGSWGLHQMLFCLVEGDVDNLLSGACRAIRIELLADGGCRYSHDGLPRRFEVGKLLPDHFDLAVVTALSTRSACLVVGESEITNQTFDHGTHLESTVWKRTTRDVFHTVSFLPDPEIFRETQTFDFDIISNRLRELAFLNRGLAITLIDSRSKISHQAHYLSKQGIIEFVERVNQSNSRKPVHCDVFHVEGGCPGQEFEVAMQWTHAADSHVISYANFLPTRKGTHVEGLHRSLTHLLKRFGRYFGFFRDEPITVEDWLQGLTAVLSVKLAEPVFAGAMKEWISNKEIRAPIAKTVRNQFHMFLESYPEQAEEICRRILEAHRQRMARKRPKH